MRLSEAPWYETLDFLIGFEGEGDEEEDDSGEEEDDAGEEEDNEGDEEGDEKSPKSDDLDGLKSALAKERKDRKKSERELKRLQRQKADEDDTDTKEVDKARKKAEAADAKVTKLGEKLAKTAVDGLITRFANAKGFRDVDDALALVKRDSEWVDQDEEDPADMELDEKSIQAAVDKLATDKPHLIKADGEQEASGENNGRKKKTSELDEEKLRDKYPALRR